MPGAGSAARVAAPAPAGPPSGGVSPGARALAAELLEAVPASELVRAARSGGRRGVLEALDRRIAAIDGLMTAQVNAILHHPRFQRLEGSWRGLAYLVAGLETRESLRIRVLPVGWQMLARDLERAAEFDRSVLFRKIYEDEFGMPGGEPFGLIVADYYLIHRPGRHGDHVAALRGLAGVAAASFCPVVLGAAPEMFGLDGFRDLHPTLDLDRLFGLDDYARWRGLQSEADTRFLAVALPRVLIRRPLGELERTDRFRFAEDVSAPDGEGWLWAHPGYAFASVVMRAYAEAGWFADIRGTRSSDLRGGLVRDLPRADFTTDAPGVAPRAPLEMSLSEPQERALSDLGFLPVSASPYSPYAIFHTCQSLARPQTRSGGVAAINARMSAMLNYVLCVSRFAHYLKVIGRDMVGSGLSAADCQERLQAWLYDYTMAPTGAERDLTVLARRPLSEAQVQVSEAPGQPGSYRCTIHLRPHYQLDDVVSTFRLTTEIAPAAAR